MKKLIILLFGGTMFWSCNQHKDGKAINEPSALEFADAKYIAVGMQSLTKLAEGDVDAFMDDYADDAVYIWNNGDSIVSKKAIAAYWKDRRTNVIDAITFKNEAWLAIQANDPPKHIVKGVWLLNWASFTITYSTGKSVTMSIHNAFHFNGADKIDRAIQYLDRGPIAAALVKN